MNDSSSTSVIAIQIAENCLVLTAKGATLASVGCLLVYSKFCAEKLRLDKFSTLLYVYLFTQFVGATLSFPYSLYKLILSICRLLAGESPSTATTNNGSLCNLTVYFWLGIWEMVYVSCEPICATLLTTNRICSLKPLSWIGRRPKVLSIVGIILLVFFVCFSFCEWMLELSSALHVASNQKHSCQALPFQSCPQLTLKLAFGGANIAACLTFLAMLNKASSNAVMAGNQGGGGMASKKRFIILSILADSLFDVCPSLMALFLNSLAGSHIATALFLKVTGFSVYYWHKFRKHSSTLTVIVQQPRGAAQVRITPSSPFNLLALPLPSVSSQNVIPSVSGQISAAVADGRRSMQQHQEIALYERRFSFPKGSIDNINMTNRPNDRKMSLNF